MLDDGFERVMGIRQGIDSVNENREKLKEFCDFNEMVITGKLFQHKEIHKLKWVSPMEKFKSSVIDTRVMRYDQQMLPVKKKMLTNPRDGTSTLMRYLTERTLLTR